VYLCDTFTGVVKVSSNDLTYKGGEHADTAIELVENLIKKLELDNVVILTGIFPDQTQHLIKDNKFRFCHIDVDVYQSAKDIFNWVWPKLVVGGIVVFDDYGFYTCEGISLFVDQERKKKNKIVIHNLNGHAIIIKLTEEIS
jgi:O-methyltransferase